MPIWRQRPADDNGDLTLLHNECNTCGRKWTSMCAWWAAEHNAARSGPCWNGAKFGGKSIDPPDLSEACLSDDITTIIGERLPRDEAYRRMDERNS